MLSTFSAIADTPEGQELILKIKEAKLKQETIEAQENEKKSNAEIIKENPVAKKPDKISSEHQKHLEEVK